MGLDGTPPRVLVALEDLCRELLEHQRVKGSEIVLDAGKRLRKERTGRAWDTAQPLPWELPGHRFEAYNMKQRSVISHLGDLAELPPQFLAFRLLHQVEVVPAKSDLQEGLNSPCLFERRLAHAYSGGESAESLDAS